MSREGGQEDCALCVPDPGGLVAARRDDARAIRAKRRGLERAIVTPENRHRRASRSVPNPHGAVAQLRAGVDRDDAGPVAIEGRC